MDTLKELEDEIRHFQYITVTLKDISEVQGKAERVRRYQDPEAMKQVLRQRLERGEITVDEYTEGIKHDARMVREERKVDGYCAMFTENGSARDFQYDE